MLATSTIQFLKNLKKNNNKPWFDANRKTYESAKADYNGFVAQLINAVAKFDATIAPLEVKQCVFRINRDVRFSNNKDPYKTNMGASLNKGAKKMNKAGYYFHLEPGASFVAGGIYMPEAADLAKVRQEIDYNLADFEKIVKAKKFVTTFNELSNMDGGKLSRPPKGYEANNPAIEYLKYKSFIVSTPIPDALLTDKALLKTVAAHMQLIQPLVQFINHAMEE